MMKSSTSYVEANRFAKAVAVAFFLLYWLSVAATIDWSSYPFRPSLTANNGVYHIAMYVVFFIVWTSAIYLLYLAYVSLLAGVFPPSDAIVPFRTRQINGAWAYAACCTILVSATLLIALPFFWKYLIDLSILTKEMELEALRILSE